MSTSCHPKQHNPLGFHFSIPPTTNCFHRPLCTSCWDSFKHRKSAFCLGLLPVDSWDSCCHCTGSPSSCQGLGWAGRQQQGGRSVCLPLVIASNPLIPGYPLATGEGTRAVVPGCLWEEARGPTALMHCSRWKSPWWLNTGMKSKWIIVVQDWDQDDFCWTCGILGLPWDNSCLSSQLSPLWFCTKLEDSSPDCDHLAKPSLPPWNCTWTDWWAGLYQFCFYTLSNLTPWYM